MSISTRLRNFAREARGQALLASYAAGALLALIFAPFYIWPLAFLCLPVFFILLDASISRRQAALRGIAFGFGHFMAGTWWIANALTVDMAKFGWLIPFCVLGISAALSVYFGLFGYLYHRIKTPHLFTNLLRFAVLWVAIEYLRSIGIFGFPWNLAGYAALASLKVAQLASLIGTFGLSMFVIALGLLPVLALEHTKRRTRIAGILLPVLLIAAAHAYGEKRLQQPVELSNTTVRIVQPSIAQDVKGTAEWETKSIEVLSQLARNSDDATLPPADFTVWPETAYPTAVRGNRVGALKPTSGTLVTGALRVEGGEGDLRIYNSIVAIDPTGLVLMAYDKHQLVPFGEFVPLRDVLNLNRFTPGDLDFTRGSGAQTILLRDQPSFSPLVCYEAIFPWMAADPENRPAWLVNVTNDGWYGDSPGPYQHLAMARMRAIEQGLPLVRAANTGISALIDPYGRITTKLALNVRGVINARLPQALPPTHYEKTGEWQICLGLLAILLLSLMCQILNKNK